MTNVYKALKSAMAGMDTEEIAALVIDGCTMIGRTDYKEKKELVTRLTTALGVKAEPPASGGKRSWGGSGYFLREVLEHDPSVNNGYGITDGEFISSLSKYTGDKLVLFATKGSGDKLIAIGKKSDVSNWDFKFPSGKDGTVANFAPAMTCDNWKEAHDYLKKAGIPQGKSSKAA